MKCYHCKSKKIKQTPAEELNQFECGLITIGDELSFAIIKECRDNQDWYYKLSDEQRASIERGLKDVEEGRVISHEELKRQIREKFGF
jgi:hypothetical protein